VAVELSTRLQRRMAAIAACLVLANAPLAQAEPLPDATERVIALARVWAQAKFFHPYLAYKDIDWDAALVAAIPKAEAATTPAEYRAAVQGMLAILRDPVTRVVDAPTGNVTNPAPAEWLTTPSPGVLEVKLAGLATEDLVAGQGKAMQITTE